MLVLKETLTERIVMYGSDSREHLYFLGLLEKKIGSKSQLGTKTAFAFKNNDFWKEIIGPVFTVINWLGNKSNIYLDYENGNAAFLAAKESGLSALSQVKGEYILIVREVLE